MKKMQKGFTLIELMIVIAIIAIIAAIAIPNLLASRIRASEASAVAAIKQISTAQVTFQSGRQGRNAANTNGGASGFCSNFRNLAYGQPVGGAAGNKLSLISDAVADAFVEVGAPVAVATAVPAPGAAANYQGYLFQNDPAIPAGIAGWGTNFATIAIPATGGTTGNNEYWVGQAGTVFVQGVANGVAAAPKAAGDTPETAMGNWTML